MAQRRLFIIAIFLVYMSAFAWAGSLLDIPIGDAGKVRYGNHGHGALQGSGISVAELISGTSTLKTVGGRLSFSTTKGLGQSGDSLLYGTGGQIVMRGCIKESGEHGRWCQKGDIRGVLMRGTFLNARVVDQDGKLFLIAQFIETLNPALAALLGLPVESEGTFDLLLSSVPSRWGNLEQVVGGSLNLLSEPSSIAMLISGLLGLFLPFGVRVISRRGDPVCSEP